MSKYTGYKSDINIIKPAVAGAVKALIQLEEVSDVINATNSVVMTLLNYEMNQIDALISTGRKDVVDTTREFYAEIASGALTLAGEMAKRLGIPVEDFADLLKEYDFEPHSIYGGTMFKEQRKG